MQQLRLLGEKLSGKIIETVNSTFSGGGVAEILSRMVPLMGQIGVDIRWHVIKGNDEFFEVTKKFHNALHGREENLSPADFSTFLQTSKKNLEEMDFCGQILFIHDPQPIVLVEKKKTSDRKWVWRCHVDVSNPNEQVWGFLKNYINQYDAAIFSAPSFSQPLPIRQFLISPSIDPLSDKNKELPEETINQVLKDFNISKDKPIITQISRFDFLKDPVGVIEAFKLVRKSIDCQLILAGGTATDDPESEKVLQLVDKAAGDYPDIHVLLIPTGSDIQINALQRASNVILQKSIKEGFGLTVSEALWKEKPVVASAVGGIPLQIVDNYTGLLSHGVEGTAFAIRKLLANPAYAAQLGKNGKEHVRQNFLITRQIRDYLLLFLTLDRKEDVIYL